MAEPISLQEVTERFHLEKGQLDAVISEEHLKDVQRVIDDHEILGSQLGLTVKEMTDINRERSPELQRLAMLTKWKQKFAWKATYRRLIEALLKCSRTDVAEDVCKLAAQNASVKQHTAALPTSPLNHPAATSIDGNQHGDNQNPVQVAHSTRREKQLPGTIVDAPEVSLTNVDQEEGEEDTRQLRQEVKHMEEMFGNLCNATSNVLQASKVSIHKIRRSLCIRRASDTQTDTDLLAGHQHEIWEAETVGELFDILSNEKCWNFLDPRLLKRIIDDHCSESRDIQHLKEDYLEKLRHFRKTTLARKFAKVFKVRNPNMFSEVVFEMGKDWDNATLDDVENLKQEIHAQGYLSDHVFNFKRPKSSFISLVWAFPCSCPIGTTILRIPPSFYLKHGIRRVLVKGVCVVDVKFEKEQEEAVAKEMDITLKLQQQHNKDIDSMKEEIVASAEKFYIDKLNKTEERLKAKREENEELKKLLRQKEIQTADYEDKITSESLTKELEASQKLPEKNKGGDKGTTAMEEMSEFRCMLLRQHEDKERKLLLELKRMKGVKEGRKPTPATGNDSVESRGIMYHMKYGCTARNAMEVLILVSVGSEFPAGVQVQPRTRDSARAENATHIYGRLPSIVTGLHEEAATDLMATASQILRESYMDLTHLCVDIPGKQHSKEYYLKTIEEFLGDCKQPAATLYYLGHSEVGTGNWCFKGGTISFQEIFDIYRRHCPGKLLTIVTDCCYSGKWVKECAKTLDGLGIPPCGHRAREKGILIKVFASCQPDQKAAEPCYSVEGVTVKDDGTLILQTTELSAHQKALHCDATRLACCSDPDEPCRSEEGLKNWTWQDAVDSELWRRVHIVRGTIMGQSVWHIVLLFDKDEAYKEQFLEKVKSGNIDLGEWGYIIKSGWDKDPPEGVVEKIATWMWV